MWWREKLFLWWTELDNQPTYQELDFWARIRVRGPLHYLSATLSQLTVIMLGTVTFIVFILFLLGGTRIFDWFTAFSGITVLITLLRGFPELYLRWRKNETVFLAAQREEDPN
jgi:hypothetical protein